MKVFVSQPVKCFLIQYTGIPQPVSLFVEFFLEVLRYYILYLMCVFFAMVEREELQQIQLCRG